MGSYGALVKRRMTMDRSHCGIERAERGRSMPKLEINLFRKVSCEKSRPLIDLRVDVITVLYPLMVPTAASSSVNL